MGGGSHTHTLAVCPSTMKGGASILRQTGPSLNSLTRDRDNDGVLVSAVIVPADVRERGGRI